MLINSACLSVTGSPCQINKILSHPTLPITITAQEDRHIKFFDNTSGKLIHSMVAHLDAVTSLAVDPNGLYLMSGSKQDSSCFHHTQIAPESQRSRCVKVATKVLFCCISISLTRIKIKE